MAEATTKPTINAQQDDKIAALEKHVAQHDVVIDALEKRVVDQAALIEKLHVQIFGVTANSEQSLHD